MRELITYVSRVTCRRLEIKIPNHRFWGKAAGRKRFVIKVKLIAEMNGVETAVSSESVLEGQIQTDFWELNRRASERSVVVEAFPGIKIPFPGFLGVIKRIRVRPPFVTGIVVIG